MGFDRIHCRDQPCCRNHRRRDPGADQAAEKVGAVELETARLRMR